MSSNASIFSSQYFPWVARNCESKCQVFPRVPLPRVADNAMKMEWTRREQRAQKRNEDDEYVVFDRIHFARSRLACVCSTVVLRTCRCKSRHCVRVTIARFRLTLASCTLTINVDRWFDQLTDWDSDTITRFSSCFRRSFNRLFVPCSNQSKSIINRIRYKVELPSNCVFLSQ